MRNVNRFTTASIICLLLFVSGSAQSDVEKSLDRFSNTITITMKPQTLIYQNQQNRLVLAGECEIIKASSSDVPQMAGLKFTAFSPELISSSVNELELLIDGQLVIAARATAIKNLRTKATMVRSDIKFETLMKVGKAKTVEMRLGGLKFTVPSSALEAVREFAQAIGEEEQKYSGAGRT